MPSPCADGCFQNSTSNEYMPCSCSIRCKYFIRNWTQHLQVAAIIMAKHPRSSSVDIPPESRSRSSSPAPTPTPKIHLPTPSPHDQTQEVMRCSLPPHREDLSFSSYEDYEVHYRQAHVNRCTQCGGNFPTDLFLNLHIEENHDSLVAERRERGEKTVCTYMPLFSCSLQFHASANSVQYGCFVEDCEKKCSTPQKRRMHLVDKHMFPKVLPSSTSHAMLFIWK